MLEKNYDSTPIFGFSPKDKTRFSDSDLFGEELWKYAVLKKIKIWWGTPKKVEGSELPNGKSALGIQCEYEDVVSGAKKLSEQHCGNLDSPDIETKELTVGEGEYFSKFYIGFDLYITHLKFSTSNGNSIEFGDYKEEFEKTVELNSSERGPFMIQCFIGYYNETGLRALGCRFIEKKHFILIDLMGVLRLRHILKINDEQKKQWSKAEEQNKLDKEMQVIIRVCLMPDAQFSSVMKFCI